MPWRSGIFIQLNKQMLDRTLKINFDFFLFLSFLWVEEEAEEGVRCLDGHWVDPPVHMSN